MDHFFIPFIILIVTAVSNAANLTDELRWPGYRCFRNYRGYPWGHGLCRLICIFADYLDLFNLILPSWSFLACAWWATCVGFLWYNAFPAQIFMGDTGSLTLVGSSPPLPLC
ncbi:MAG: hypothetical protein R2787_00975 [Saprospiraceae bacterium]